MANMPEQLKEIERRWDKLIESGEALDLVRVNARVTKPTGSVHSTRYSFDEISLIYKAAEQRGMTTSAFIRQAALAAAANELDLASAAKASDWQKIRKLARELSEAVEPRSEAEAPAKPPRKRKAS